MRTGTPDDIPPEQIDLVRKLQNLNKRMQRMDSMALEKLHETLRNELMRLCNGPAAEKYGQDVEDRLRGRAEELRMEGLKDWWDGRKTAADDLDELEQALVDSFGGTNPDKEPYLATFLDTASRSVWQSFTAEADPSFGGHWLSLPPSYVAAWMTLKRTDTVPPANFSVTDTKGKTIHVSALEGLREMLAAQQWRMLAMTMGSPGWLLMLAQLWITDRAEEELSRRELHSSAHDLSTRTRILVGDHEFGRSPKEMSAMAWATGGQGVRHENETGMMFMLPPGSSLLTRNDHGRPHQDFLPFMDQDPDRSSLPITMAHAHREVMPVTSTKLMLLTLNFLLTAKSPRAMKTTLRELTKEVNPGARIVRSHYETVADALQTLDGLSVVLPNHNWVSYRIFDLPTPVRTPKPEDYDSDLLMGISSAFLEAVRSSHAGSSYSGYFLYSLTGAMGLPANRPALMRHYLRASSWWNAERVKGGSPSVNIETERWAIITNTMTLSAVEGRRDQKSRSITNTIKDLQELADRKLVVAKRIDKKRIILEIPENLEAAYKQIYEGKRNVRNPSR